MNYYQHNKINYNEKDLKRIAKIAFINYPIRISRTVIVFDMSRFGLSGNKFIVQTKTKEAYKIQSILNKGSRKELDEYLYDLLLDHVPEHSMTLHSKLCTKNKNDIKIVYVSNFNELYSTY